MKLKLGVKDSAIVFLGNGESVLHVPTPKNDNDLIPDSAFKVALCVTFLNDKELVEQVSARIHAQTETEHPTIQ